MTPCSLETIWRRCQDIFVDLDAARLCQALSAAFSVQNKPLKQWYKYFCCFKRENDLSKKGREEWVKQITRNRVV